MAAACGVGFTPSSPDGSWSWTLGFDAPRGPALGWRRVGCATVFLRPPLARVLHVDVHRVRLEPVVEAMVVHAHQAVLSEDGDEAVAEERHVELGRQAAGVPVDGEHVQPVATPAREYLDRAAVRARRD